MQERQTAAYIILLDLKINTCLLKWKAEVIAFPFVMTARGNKFLCNKAQKSVIEQKKKIQKNGN